MNVNGMFNPSRAGVIPQITNGTHTIIKNTFFQLLNRSNKMIKITKNVKGKYENTIVLASLLVSCSPTHWRL